MSKGKYSPSLPGSTDFSFNCHAQTPAPWTKELADAGLQYDDMTMFGNYDADGFDSYGYSAFNAEGNFVGHGCGVDRLGNTEMDYLSMSDEDFLSV